MRKKIWLSAPHQTAYEQQYLQEVLAANWLAPNGRQVQQFEHDLARYIQAPAARVVMTNSGTAAIHMALRALGVSQGDFVICQTLTFVGSVNPVMYLGATPVFVDSELISWNMCPEALEEAIQYCSKYRRLPKAIIVVDLFGNPANWEVLQNIASHYGIPIIEDAAEALGSTYKESKLGMCGDIGIYSFNGNKIITATSGGAVVANNEQSSQRIRFWINQSKEPTRHYEHKEIGFNYQMSEVCGAIGRAQLQQITQRVQARRAVFNFYKKSLPSDIQFQQELTGGFSNRWLTAILLPDPKQRAAIEEACLVMNIDCRRIWKPLHLQPLFKGSLYFGNAYAEYLFEYGLCLPSGSSLTLEELSFVRETIVSGY